MKRINKQGGFTLLELLVVVAILAIIAGSVISALTGQEERAGQGVAVHAMGALENATRQHDVLNKGLPSSLDSLMCIDTTGLNSGDDTNSAAVLAATVFGATSNVNGESGGLTEDFGEKLDAGAAAGVQPLVLPVEGVEALAAAGLGSLRFAETTYCNDDDSDGADVADIDVAANLDDTELDEVNANRIFLQPSEGEGGRGIILDVDDGNTLPVLAFAEGGDSEADDIGGVDGDVVAVFGIGPGSSFISNGLIGRAPRDGNAPGGSYYSNYSIAYTLGNDADGDLSDLSDVTWQEEATFLAILDSDGDYYDDEVAEFAGLEDE